MATCTVTFADTDDGQITARIEFDPAIDDATTEVSAAQGLGARILEQIVAEAQEDLL